jgi:phage gpG-like protein
MDFPEAIAGYIRMRAEFPEVAPKVATAMGQKYKDTVQSNLRRMEHGVGTRTPAPPFGFPATMTGELAGSITDTVFPGAEYARAVVAPHTIYARIQEEGGLIWANPKLGAKGKRPHTLHFVTDGVHYFPHDVWLPERPYMALTTAQLVADGELHRTAEVAFLDWVLEWMGTW